MRNLWISLATFFSSEPFVCGSQECYCARVCLGRSVRIYEYSLLPLQCSRKRHRCAREYLWRNLQTHECFNFFSLLRSRVKWNEVTVLCLGGIADTLARHLPPKQWFRYPLLNSMMLLCSRILMKQFLNSWMFLSFFTSQLIKRRIMHILCHLYKPVVPFK